MISLVLIGLVIFILFQRRITRPTSRTTHTVNRIIEDARQKAHAPLTFNDVAIRRMNNDIG